MGAKESKRGPQGLKYESPAPSQPHVPPTWADRIPDQARWDFLAHRPQDSRFARQSVVKFIIHIKAPPSHDQVEVYFLQSKHWVFHHQFCKQILGHPTADKLSTFNAKHYLEENRDFILGTAIYYSDQDIYTFELAPRDTLSGARILLAFKEIQRRVYFGEKLRFRALSETHKTSISGITDLPLVDSSELYKGIKYQPLTEGVAVGKLLFLRRSDDEEAVLDQVSPSTILLCEEIPNDLPAIAALVTCQLQTPLCHVALLSANRNTPNMALIDGSNDPRLFSFIGKYVKLTVTLRDFTVEETTQEEVEIRERAKRQARLEAAPKLKYSLDVTNVLDLSVISTLPTRALREYYAAMGSKATQIVEMARLKELQVEFLERIPFENSYVVPFYFYNEHIQSSCGPALSGFLERCSAGSVSTQEMRDTLAALRQKIESAELSESCQEMALSLQRFLLGWLGSDLKSLCDGVILRSSTNVEDIDGFNGAGLYESLRIRWEDISDITKLQATIKSVWSSVWNFRGFEERHVFGMQQEHVQMALLVQPFFGKTSVHCNGVAITAHPFRSDFPGYFINAQVAGKSVTDNAGIPEQIIVWNYNHRSESEKLATSSEVAPGEDLMSYEDINRLSEVLTILENAFTDSDKSKYLGKTYKWICKHSVDVEFLVLNPSSAGSTERNIVILQCRPFMKQYFHDDQADY